MHPNQNKYYINYFLLLLCSWEYMPTDRQINDIQKFIIKFYNNNLYLKIFNTAVIRNYASIKGILNSRVDFINNKYEYLMKTLGGKTKNITKQ